MKYGDLTLDYTQGAGGRTRWMLRDADDKVQGQSHGRGYRTEADAAGSFDRVRTALTADLRDETMRLRRVVSEWDHTHELRRPRWVKLCKAGALLLTGFAVAWFGATTLAYGWPW